MLIKCPACGASASLDALIDDEPAAQALMLALKLSPVGRSLVKYLGLFRPAKRQLSWSKVVTLLGELTPMIESQRISRNGVIYEAPMAVWEVAIDKVLMMRDSGKLATPLKSHGYLLEIIVTEAGKNLPVVQLVEGVDAMNRVSTKPLSATAQAIINLEARKQGASHVAG
jgi:hypothetical protein